MQRWEYRAVRIVYDYSDDVHDWLETGGDRSRVGWSAILNAYGQDGWELVGFSPQLTTGKGDGPVMTVVDRFRLVFKRPVEGS
jgi:hypothetical protein